MTTALTLADQFRITVALCEYPDPITREVMLCLAPLTVPTTATTGSVSVNLFLLTRVVGGYVPNTTLGQVFAAIAGLVDAGVIAGGMPNYHLDARIDLSPLPRRRSSGPAFDGQAERPTYRRLDVEGSHHHAEGTYFDE